LTSFKNSDAYFIDLQLLRIFQDEIEKADFPIGRLGEWLVVDQEFIVHENHRAPPV